jgi:succinoglycan biosynthesis protein ExoA
VSGRGAPEPLMPEAPLISICILSGHGSDALGACLESLRAQESPPAFELIVGGPCGPDAVSVVRRHFPDAQICPNKNGHPGAARNSLIERASGELLLFLDDDVTVRPDLLHQLARTAARYPEASVFGGPNETPPRSSLFEVVQGAVLGSAIGSGPVSRRYGARHAGRADERWFTLCNLAVRRAVMVPFVSDLVCAEENALLSQLRARGEQMQYDPGLRVFHSRRPTWRKFARQMLKYGRGRGQLVARSPGTVRAAYLAPAALLLYLLLIPVLLAVSVGLLLALAPLALYLALVISSALWIGLTLGTPSSVPLAAWLTLTIHVCYGAGVLQGIFSPLQARSGSPASWSAKLEDVLVHEHHD